MPVIPIRAILLLLLVASFSACSPRGEFRRAALPPDAVLQKVYIASDRIIRLNGDPDFGERRDDAIRYAVMDISIPPVHAVGNIEWPHGDSVDARRHFALANATRFEGADPFLAALRRDLPPGEDQVLLFVHGFNVNNAEAVYRLAQLAHDFRAQRPAVLYSWPSSAKASGYVYDRDSVIFSRDGLETVLHKLVRGGLKVHIVAHSMGTQLTMETLRQMSIGGHRRTLAGIDGLTLISPDIDADVFRRQAQRIDPLPQPLALLVSRRDRALDVAAFITGTRYRLGSITEPNMLADLPVEIIDITDVGEGGGLGHSVAFTSPQVIALLSRLRDAAVAALE